MKNRIGDGVKNKRRVMSYSQYANYLQVAEFSRSLILAAIERSKIGESR